MLVNECFDDEERLTFRPDMATILIHTVSTTLPASGLDHPVPCYSTQRLTDSIIVDTEECND